MAAVPNDPNLTIPGMMAVIWVETGLAAVFALTRAIFRICEHEKPLKNWQKAFFTSWRFDDYCVGFAWTTMFMSSMFLTQVIPAEFLLRGLESGHIPPTPYILAYESIFLRNQFIMIILFWVTIWLVKASFLAFYRQLFTRQFFGWQRSAWWIVVFFTVSTWIANFVLQFFVCVPFKSYFTLGACNSPRNIAVSNDSLYFATASDIFTDLLIMALPLTIIPQLQMDVKTKAALASLFLTGFIIILFAILRLVFTIPKNGHVNPKWLAIWSTTEMCIAIAVSIAPTFRKYFVARNRGVAIGEQGAPQINRDPPMVVSADTEEGK